MVDEQLILDSVGPVQAILDAHDGIVNVIAVSYTHLTLPTNREV